MKDEKVRKLLARFAAAMNRVQVFGMDGVIKFDVFERDEVNQALGLPRHPEDVEWMKPAEKVAT